MADAVALAVKLIRPIVEADDHHRSVGGAEYAIVGEVYSGYYYADDEERTDAQVIQVDVWSSESRARARQLAEEIRGCLAGAGFRLQSRGGDSEEAGGRTWYRQSWDYEYIAEVDGDGQSQDDRG